MFFGFLDQIRFRTPLKSPQNQVLDRNRANSLPPAPCLELQSAFAAGWIVKDSEYMWVIFLHADTHFFNGTCFRFIEFLLVGLRFLEIYNRLETIHCKLVCVCDESLLETGRQVRYDSVIDLLRRYPGDVG